jgi:CRP/FNR family transcriptional regulator, cyclic AMP receptor protein
MTDEPFDFATLLRHGVKFRRFDAGERIFLENDPGDELYVVHTGRVEVLTFGSLLESVGPSGIFGEMALIDECPRAAAALASEPTEVAVVDMATFMKLIGEEPKFALRVMRALTERIRRIGGALTRQARS